MAEFTSFTDKDFTEREAVHAVAAKLSKAKLLWRETPNTDVGIDGQIEHSDSDGRATGLLVAAQVKGGASYFLNETDGHVPYYPSDAHRNYWGLFPIPVILILHDPRDDRTFWVDARNQLRSPEERITGKAIRVPKANLLTREQRDNLFTAFGPRSQPLDFPQLVEGMIENRNLNPQLPLSFFKLFFAGLTDISRKLYFHMDLTMELAEFELSEQESEFGWAMGSEDYDFLDRYFDFISSQGLAHVDYADLIYDREVRHMTPSAIWPLTKRGIGFVDYLSGLQQEVLEHVPPDWDAFTPAVFERLRRIKDNSDMTMKSLEGIGYARERRLICTMESYVTIWAHHKFASLRIFEEGFKKMKQKEVHSSRLGAEQQPEGDQDESAAVEDPG